MVDEDGSGSLDFEEFVQLLLIYRPRSRSAESSSGYFEVPSPSAMFSALRKNGRIRRVGGWDC